MSTVLHLCASAAAPVQYIGSAVRSARRKWGWDVHLLLTPTAPRWMEAELPELEELTGHPVRHRYDAPWQSESEPLPLADVVLVAPVSAADACAWAWGVTPDPAPAVPAEASYRSRPVLAMPYWHSETDRQRSLRYALDQLRRRDGVRVLRGRKGYRPHPPGQGDPAAYPWETALAAAERELGWF
ncbi:flavoprotein [Streptomyces sp. WMMB303]|uniref:flavoprotein n=1 Tax=Streptomyces sp. WMMB303 TaxID=3034154 RepID=UPI0023EB0DE4|nr:flavoprotein [Streptomyces sp. WMMB303]MDF4250950.1 flavoprotein [Streptomyces sp. WMMB303]